MMTNDPETLYVASYDDVDSGAKHFIASTQKIHEQVSHIQYSRTDLTVSKAKYKVLENHFNVLFHLHQDERIKKAKLQNNYDVLKKSHDRLVTGIRRSIQLLSNRGYQKEASELLDLLPDEDQKEID